MTGWMSAILETRKEKTQLILQSYGNCYYLGLVSTTLQGHDPYYMRATTTTPQCGAHGLDADVTIRPGSSRVRL